MFGEAGAWWRSMARTPESVKAQGGGAMVSPMRCGSHGAWAGRYGRWRRVSAASVARGLGEGETAMDPTQQPLNCCAWHCCASRWASAT